MGTCSTSRLASLVDMCGPVLDDPGGWQFALFVNRVWHTFLGHQTSRSSPLDAPGRVLRAPRRKRLLA